MNAKNKTAEASEPQAPSTYPLLYPIKYRPADAKEGDPDIEITSLVMRRAKGKDLRALEAYAATGAAGNAGFTMAFLASINDLPLTVLDELDAEDLMEVSGKVVGFLPESFLRQAQQDGEA